VSAEATGVDLYSAAPEDFGQALEFADALLNELLAVASRLPHRGDLWWWDATPSQQPALSQLRQPRRIQGVALRTRTFLTCRALTTSTGRSASHRA
jgi:hypothetical protein